jgi:catechol 2,3-dioxygenase-like lactoylglutathione lyase family enzyme
MPSRSHHVACATDDPDRVHEFLTEVVGMPEHLRFRVAGEALTATGGWPPSDGADVVMYGTAPAGIVEVIAIPDELRGRVAPGIWLVSFATSDVDAAVAAARARGFEASDPYAVTGDVSLTASFATVGGIPFELVRFDG